MITSGRCACGGVVDDEQFWFDTCRPLTDELDPAKGPYAHYRNGERVGRHMEGTFEMEILIDAPL